MSANRLIVIKGELSVIDAANGVKVLSSLGCIRCAAIFDERELSPTRNRRQFVVYFCLHIERSLPERRQVGKAKPFLMQKPDIARQAACSPRPTSEG